MKKISLAFLILASTAGTISSAHCRADDRIQGAGNFATGIQGSGNAQIEVRNLTGFNKVVAGGAVNVEIVAQKDFGVSVEADDNLLPILKTEVRGDTLRIYSTNDYTPKTRINVRISLPDIEVLELSGSSTATIANVKAHSLELKASGSSKIKVDGDANSLSVNASGSSEIDAEKLRVVNAKVNASGSSQAIVSATDEIDANVSGSSRVFYIGKPKNLKQNTSGSSSINQK